MGARSFLLPDLGEGLTEAELISWSVTPGDTVELNQVIAEVETAKASVELPSPYAGVVLALHVDAGDTVEVGTPIIDIGDGADDVASPSAASPSAVSPSAVSPSGEAASVEAPSTAARNGADHDDAGPDGRVPVLVGYGVAGETASRRATTTPADTTPPVATPSEPDSRPLAAPPVRFLARQEGIDLTDVPPTGPRGEVTREDVAAYLDRAAGESDSAPLDTPARETRTPIKGVRKHTADAMVRSAFTAPHVTEFVTVDVTPTMELLDRLRRSAHLDGVRLTPLVLVAKALLIAVRRNPSLNSSWEEENREIVTKHYVNLGIAAATPRGLMVPNVKDADRLSLRDLALALSDLTAVAKEGKTGPRDLEDGTITITNVGVFGVDSGTPILNPGEAAILCMGAIRPRPWEFEGQIALRQVTTLSVSFDHRLVDGEQGSRFLADIAAVLSDPMALIAMS
ncbi:dihydrolipoamide acetyltransferase family protein [Rhodococcoides corynebacterioides]|uniref:Dihydrolipoamide acetyltransferase component of pyruvate dehydrogenase complex n=1 Tax=Rhodococcoides corynebacterioides TaxID=53972 RepID=A0ABS7P0B2_9NOCA|nr:dihydrolipoamide acetyltransferase family protein [Rhodococcus corynebacterioides]MBY6365853.1 2-oxo acid dehydrogenase subunit E2 [Rhodococcus corynebacterioides]MBY6408198.1 2-oxo acid dehydrogenase subunit E2 [Rhodococcus corynebacterioides]